MSGTRVAEPVHRRADAEPGARVRTGGRQRSTSDTPVERPGPVRFRILGSLEYHDGTTWRLIGSAKQRSLLAVLLLNANQVVGVDRLIAELWPDGPAATASGLLAGYVWRLRTALGDQAGTVLVTQSPGYRLVVPSMSLDVHEFEAFAVTARSRQAAGDLAGAAESFAAAMALWRGTPLADVAMTPAVLAERARLEEAQLSVAEGRLGVGIELGHHESLLPELKLLVAQFPLRERLHAHLMRALYRCGDQADALGAYRDLRRLLVSELGIEPTKPLRDLQQRILQGDPALLGNTEQRPAPSASGPRLHRGPVVTNERDEEVFGREEELAAVTTRLVEDRVCVVHGFAGAGKSALAALAARRLADRFPDGQVHLDMRSSTDVTPLRPVEVIGSLAQATSTAPRPQDGADGWPTAAAGLRLLVVLDDVHRADQARPLMSPPPGCALLVVSRAPLEVTGARSYVHVGRLSAAASIRLLRDSLGAHRVDAESGAAGELARRCEYLPLALRIAATRLAARPSWSLRDFADRLADPRCRLDLLASSELSVRASLRGGLRLLGHQDDTDALAALRLLGALDMPLLGLDVLAALLRRDPNTARGIAERLVDAGLLETPGVDSYRVPDLVRLFAREQRDVDVDIPGAIGSVVEYYLGAIRSRLSTMDSSRNGARAAAVAEGTSWYRKEISSLRSLAIQDRTDTLHKAVDQLRWFIHGGRLSTDRLG
ncbi:AfsR/SARP family transcriptional regulator [Labedaea rhizosphaerae]|uniref:DNA-binding SARP family transcriptional activator n=1 Tax=Labedaea rhizosphaerae TaxID=598644 RepID=A0A4R6S034_LABRH|nr:AfsR/SARP family transcriptional regulator [Labedaea rhizosphaerae]TDP92859.1 DNA-binding SARP family transcriptional activator [Labedaea rhizosphaerae]